MRLCVYMKVGNFQPALLGNFQPVLTWVVVRTRVLVLSAFRRCVSVNG